DKSSRDFDVPEYGGVGRAQKMAPQSELESPSEGGTPYRGYRRPAQSIKGAVGSSELSNESGETREVLGWPLATFAAKAEGLPFRRDHQGPYIAATCFVDRVSQTKREVQIKSVVRWIGKNDVADRPLAFKANCLHEALLGTRWVAIGNSG